MNKLIYLLLICLNLSVFSQQTKFPKGKIIDSILIDKGSKESFTLYLPNQFDSTKLSPIVFVFDPMARGKAGVYPFIKTSDEYGFILVCSNNTKNGPYKRNFEITNRLFNKIFTEFNIDEKRIYTAGFSGGARLASKIAILTHQIQGVVACGAGFSLNENFLPFTGSFSYAAIVGDQDMNYKDMYNTKNYLNRLNFSNEFFVYEINHKWPNQTQILRAFDWLQLEVYKKKILPVNKENIGKIYMRFYEEARKFEENNNLIYASNEYDRILRVFGKYYTLDSVNSRLKNLKDNKLLKKEEKLLESNFKEETSLTNMFIEQFRKDISQTNYNLKWWKFEINKLKIGIEKAKPAKKKMLNRLLYKIFALAIETVSIGNTVQHIDQAIFCYDICILVYPKYPPPYFKQIENYIKKNNEPEALNYLEKLLNTGYNNLNEIKENKTFKSLKSNKRFQQLMKK